MLWLAYLITHAWSRKRIEGATAATFRETQTPFCLTSSFWQGVGRAGEQLSCVIIGHLPFAVPPTPTRSRTPAIHRRERGLELFQYSVPQAAISLKQGWGE